MLKEQAFQKNNEFKKYSTKFNIEIENDFLELQDINFESEIDKLQKESEEINKNIFWDIENNCEKIYEQIVNTK